MTVLATLHCNDLDPILPRRCILDQAGHATTGWSKSVGTPALLQLIYGAGSSSADMQRRCGPDWLRNDDDDSLMVLEPQHRQLCLNGKCPKFRVDYIARGVF